MVHPLQVDEFDITASGRRGTQFPGKTGSGRQQQPNRIRGVSGPGEITPTALTELRRAWSTQVFRPNEFTITDRFHRALGFTDRRHHIGLPGCSCVTTTSSSCAVLCSEHARIADATELGRPQRDRIRVPPAPLPRRLTHVRGRGDPGQTPSVAIPSRRSTALVSDVVLNGAARRWIRWPGMRGRRMAGLGAVRKNQRLISSARNR